VRQQSTFVRSVEGHEYGPQIIDGKEAENALGTAEEPDSNVVSLVDAACGQS